MPKLKHDESMNYEQAVNGTNAKKNLKHHRSSTPLRTSPLPTLGKNLNANAPINMESHAATIANRQEISQSHTDGKQ